MELEYNFVGGQGAAALAHSKVFPRLRDLGLAFNYLKDDAASALAAERPPGLTSLDLRSNDIEDAGARALAATKTDAGKLEIFLENNLIGKAALADPALQKGIRLDGAPPFEDRATLGGSETFDPSKKPALKMRAPLPDGLPSTVEFRKHWVWEFGWVGDFPTFMTPLRRPGNGKSRTFSWLERARMTIGGFWLNDETLAGLVAQESKAEPGDRVRVDRLHAHAVVVRRTGPEKGRVVRWQSSFGAALYVELEYERALDEYFAPIAEHVVRSVYFDRKHLEQTPP